MSGYFVSLAFIIAPIILLGVVCYLVWESTEKKVKK
jgi:hypothetical protein